MSGGRRLLLAAAAMIAVLVVAGFVVARATPEARRSASTAIEAGDLTVDRLRIRVNGVRSAAITPLRAGDLITVHASVAPSTDVSVWVRTQLDFAGTDPKLAAHVQVYNGAIPTGVALKTASDTTDLLTFPGYVGTAARPQPGIGPVVLNGRRQRETVGLDTYPLAVALYIAPQTPTALLGRTLAMTAQVQSAGYRATGDIPDRDQWTEGPRLALG